MQRDLPGFYYDEAKNRYFPISSKPAAVPTGRHPTGTASRTPNLKRSAESLGEHSTSASSSSSSDSLALNIRTGSRGAIYLNPLRTSAIFQSHRQRTLHQFLCHHIASTTRVTRATVPALAHGAITSFRTTNLGGTTRCYLGDTRGWLYSLTTPADAWTSSPGSLEYSRTRGPWTPELNLASGISTICISGNRCVATSFGPSCKILVQDLSSSESYVYGPGERLVHDLWSSHLRDTSLAIGASNRAIWLQDIDTSRSIKTLPTSSDVFAIHQEQNLVYTGARNGTIARFDIRTDSDKPHKLHVGERTVASSVTHLNVVNEWQMLVAEMNELNGRLATYDLRFLRDAPLMTFDGHVNTYLPRLPVAIDPHHDFVFAAGQDLRIRAWSLRTGKLLKPSDDGGMEGPFRSAFSKTVQALQVTEDRDGMCLWAATDDRLQRYYLGQRTQDFEL